jgi:pathogenesis-related protein 1
MIKISIISNDTATMLKRNNQIRAEVYAGHPLSWSTSLASSAQSHANRLAQANTLKHSATKNGENLFASSSVTGYVSAIESWYKEKNNYNFATKKCKTGKICGHYTQIVWKESTKVGCGKARSASWGTIIVCQYNPRGNVGGKKAF